LNYGKKEKARKSTSGNRKLQQKNILQQINGLRLLQYEITYDPLEDHAIDNLPSHVQKEIDKLYDMLYKHLKQAIPRLRGLLNENTLIFLNFTISLVEPMPSFLNQLKQML